MDLIQKSRDARQFMRAVASAAASGGFGPAAAEHARQWRDPHLTEWMERAVTQPSTADGAPALMPPGAAAIVELTRARSLIGRIRGLRRVPFRRDVAIATGGAEFQWIGEGAPAPVGRLQWSAADLVERKAGGIVALSQEILEFSDPAAEGLARAEIVNGLAAFLDRAFVDPALAETNASPASLTNGATPIPGSGDPLQDLQTLIEAAVDALGTGDGLTILMSDSVALRIAAALGSAGAPAFGVGGGTLFGVPVVTSSAMGDQMVAVHAPSVLLADDGRMTVDLSRHASVLMDTDPASVEQAADAAPAYTSLWQNNLVGLRIMRWVNWEPARDNAVHVLELQEGD